MRNQKGYTLVELIICIAMIGVLAGGTCISYRLLGYADTRRCAGKMEDALNRLRLETMSKQGYHYLVIQWKADENSYYMNEVTSDEILDKDNWSAQSDKISKKIAGNKITISCLDQSGSTVIINSENPCILISFHSDSGAFESRWKQITVSSDAGTVTLHMITATGRHYIE